MRKAIVTLAIGESYINQLKTLALPSWQPYCKRHGYDLIVLSEPIDPSYKNTSKSIHWQKLLIGILPQLQTYDVIVWLDGDIVINAHTAPCIVSQMPKDGTKIGIIDNQGRQDTDPLGDVRARFITLNYLMARQIDPQTPPALLAPQTPEQYHKQNGLHGKAERVLNTGVFVFSPKLHGRYLASIYARYDHNFPDFDQTPFSFHLQDDDMAFLLDSRFNSVWSAIAAKHYPFLFNTETTKSNPDAMSCCVNAAFQNVWFMHFAGARANPLTKNAFSLVNWQSTSAVESTFPKLWAERHSFLEIQGDTSSQSTNELNQIKQRRIILS